MPLFILYHLRFLRVEDPHESSTLVNFSLLKRNQRCVLFTQFLVALVAQFGIALGGDEEFLGVGGEGLHQ